LIDERKRPSTIKDQDLEPAIETHKLWEADKNDNKDAKASWMYKITLIGSNKMPAKVG